MSDYDMHADWNTPTDYVHPDDLRPGDTFTTGTALHTVIENREPLHALAAAHGLRAIVVDTETPNGPNPCHRHTLTLPPTARVRLLHFT